MNQFDFEARCHVPTVEAPVQNALKRRLRAASFEDSEQLSPDKDAKQRLENNQRGLREVNAIQSETASILAVYGSWGRRVYLNCPYSERDECKTAGGQWDQNAGRWFVGTGTSVMDFLQWLPTPGTFCCEHGLPAAKMVLGGQQTVLVRAQRFCCGFLRVEGEVRASFWEMGNHLEPTFSDVIHGYNAPIGMEGLTGYCWSYLQEGICANVRTGHCCCLKHATGKTSQSM